MLANKAREMWEVPRDLLLGRYPDFVTGGGLPRGHVPVFVFHKLEPDVFGRKIRYLADNGYVTLSANEHFHVLLGSRPAPDRAVVLTFDDGWSSVRSVGLPILRRQGMRGIVFVVPGRTRSRPGPLHPTERPEEVTDWKRQVPAAEELAVQHLMSLRRDIARFQKWSLNGQNALLNANAMLSSSLTVLQDLHGHIIL